MGGGRGGRRVFSVEKLSEFQWEEGAIFRWLDINERTPDESHYVWREFGVVCEQSVELCCFYEFNELFAIGGFCVEESRVRHH